MGGGSGSYLESVKQLQNTRTILLERKEGKVQFDRHINIQDQYIRTYFVNMKCDVTDSIQLARYMD